MASIYDEIKTPKELVDMVTVHGLSTSLEDICRAQDIFGRATVKELVELATDNGRNNSDGEPDPDGSWSSGRRGTSTTFYSILFHIWSWEDATRFYNEHSNPKYKEIKALKLENKSMRDRADAAEKQRDELQHEVESVKEKVSELFDRLSDERLRADKAEDEVVRLKAKIYDLMEELQDAKIERS